MYINFLSVELIISKEKKIQKTATYCMIPFISSVQNKQTHRDRKEEEIRRDFLLG